MGQDFVDHDNRYRPAAGPARGSHVFAARLPVRRVFEISKGIEHLERAPPFIACTRRPASIDIVGERKDELTARVDQGNPFALVTQLSARPFAGNEGNNRRTIAGLHGRGIVNHDDPLTHVERMAA